MGAAAQTLATVYHETVSRLPQMQAPTLLMHGGRDSMSPLANSRILAGLIPDAELIVVPDSGHAFPLERPELSLELMLGWLNRRSPIPAGRPRTGLSARLEPLTRAFGLPIGVLRTGHGLIVGGVDGSVRAAPSAHQR
ncbi:MAG: alpha/beta hydrolase [Thermoleophilaceae bacterium]